MKEESNSAAKTVLWSTALVSLAAIITKLFGFIRTMTLAATYGKGVESDAFVIAFTLPSLVLSTVGAAVLSGFIPMYYRAEGDKNRFTSNVINGLTVIALGFTLVFAIFPQAIVFVFASQLDPETFAMASSLLRIIMLASAPLLLMDIFRGFLQIHKAFFFTSVIGIVNNVCIIPAIILSQKWDWTPLMAIGVASGYFVCLAALYLRSRKFGFQYQLYLNPRDNDLRLLIASILPIFMAVGIQQIDQIVDRNFASSLSSGGISGLDYAARITGLVTMMLGASLVTVLFPKMSEKATDGDTDSLKRYLAGCIQKLVPILVPATVGTMLLARPVVRLLFQRGAFTAEDTQFTAEALTMYAPMFFFSSANPLIIRAFYSLGDMKRPALCSVASVLLHIAVNAVLIGPLQHRGLALSTSISMAFSIVLLIFFLWRRLGSLGHLFGGALELTKVLLATAVMGALVWCRTQAFPVMESGTLLCAAYTVVLAVLGVGSYILLNALFRTDFLKECRRILNAFVGRKLKK